ncbi:prolyl oligopeptidase [Hypomontagnella monticulosa]|nr:prolyl oligopeptidase [Hypomontagnella monticulosa]
MDPEQPSRPKFTPEALAKLPYRGPAIPNHDGTSILYYIQNHQTGIGYTSSFEVMNIASGELWTLPLHGYAHDPIWLGNSNTIIYLTHIEGNTGVFTITIGQGPECRQLVGNIPGQAKNPRVMPLSDGTVAFAVRGLADTTGKLVKESPRDPGQVMVYDTYNVQLQETWLKPERMSIFYTALVKSENGWDFTSDMNNALLNEDPHLVCDGFDLSQEGITFTWTKQSDRHDRHAYFIQLESFSEPTTRTPERIDMQDDYPGYCSWYPQFSKDGSQIVFLLSPMDDADTTRIYIYRIGAPKAVNVFDMIHSKDWPLNPDVAAFSSSDQALHIVARDHGRMRLYELNLQRPKACPRELLCDGFVQDFEPLPRNGCENLLLVTVSSFVEKSLYLIVDTRGDSKPSVISSLTEHGAQLGISQRQVSEIYFQGAADHPIHTWVIRPSSFDENRKYPLALFIHGGPKSAWLDEWNDKWNLLLWAEQGYIVVAPNITGSRGFGIDFAKAIHDNWGGRPYNDLEKCMEHLERIPYIDVGNAVLLGGGYGGYMVNWVQGNPLGRRFKAMISDGGIFDLPTSVLQSFYRHSDEEFGGKPLKWDNMEGLEKYNPARQDLLPNWKTPMLLVHGGVDFCRPVVNSIAAFHTLQELGTPSRLVVFPYEGPGLSRKMRRLEWHRLCIAWANKYTAVAGERYITEEHTAAEDVTSDQPHDSV